MLFHGKYGVRGHDEGVKFGYIVYVKFMMLFHGKNGVRG